MKKSLIAIAALASVSVYAQSTVTITGVFDLGYRQVAAPFSTSTKGGFQNGTATSAILIQGEEDLGGGLKANFRYEINPDLTAGAGFSGNVLASGTTNAMGSHGSTNYVRTSNGANGYNFVGVSGFWWREVWSLEHKYIGHLGYRLSIRNRIRFWIWHQWQHVN